MMLKLAFACNWGNSSAELLVFLARQTPGGLGIWGRLKGVSSIPKADCLVVLEDLPDSIRPAALDLERTVFLPREAAVVRTRKDYQSYGAPLAFTHDDIHQACIWRVMRPFDELVKLDYFPKARALSTVTSALRDTPGQRVRVELVRALAHRYPDLLDAYGYGWTDELGGSYRGPLGDRFGNITDPAALCKYEGLKDYRYVLALENCEQKNYFTEKLVDAWLAWAMPIYWGCPNLGDYFPSDAFHRVDPTRSDCVDQVAAIAARPIGAGGIAAIREARNLVLHRYNLWPTLERILAGVAPGRRAHQSLIARLTGFRRGI